MLMILVSPFVFINDLMIFYQIIFLLYAYLLCNVGLLNNYVCTLNTCQDTSYFSHH